MAAARYFQHYFSYIVEVQIVCDFLLGTYNFTIAKQLWYCHISTKKIVNFFHLYFKQLQ